METGPLRNNPQLENIQIELSERAFHLSFSKFHLYRWNEENSIEQIWKKALENRWTNGFQCFLFG